MDEGPRYFAGGRDQDQPKKKKKKLKRQNGCLRRPYKQLRKEEKLKAKDKRKDMSI